MFVLDTNVLSELRKREYAHANVKNWVRTVQTDDLFLSAITIMEIEIGALQIARRDPRQGNVLRRWVDHQVLPTFNSRILPVDQDIALRCAALHVPDPRAERDALIAATALAKRFVVATRNVADFIPMGVAVLNPWD